MFTRFFLSFFRAHKVHLLRMSAVLFLTSIAFLLVWAITDLIESKIQKETRVLLWADIVLESSSQATDDVLLALDEISQRFTAVVASSIDFQTNITLQSGEILLSDIRIISQNFPVNWVPFQTSGTWVYVSEALWASIRNNSAIEIWGNYYIIDGNIPSSSFWRFSLFTEGREVWIPEINAKIDELLWIWARVEYRYFINTSQDNILALKSYLEQVSLFDSWEIEDIYSTQNQVAGVFSELQRFLQVFFVCIYVLAFFSLFFTFEALRRITERDIWLFILLWYTKKKIFFTLGALLIFISSIAFLFAVLWVSWLIWILETSPLTESINLNISMIIQSFLLTLVILIFSIYTPVYSLLSSPIWNLLKPSGLQSLSTVSKTMLLSLFWGIVTLLLLLWTSITWIFIVTICFLLFILVLAWIIRIYFFSLFRLSHTIRKKYFYFFYTLRSLIRPWNMTLFITLPVMIVWSIFFFFIVFALSFLDGTRVPENSNSYFILNIWEREKISLESEFQELQIYDILLARIVSINSIPLRDIISEGSRRGEFTREFNLTTHPLPDNLYESWEALSKNGVSLDVDFAERLGVSIWDDIQFLLAGREVSFEVQNLRPAIRGDFRPFFYFQLRAEDLSWLERSYFATLSDTQFSQAELQSQLFDISPRLQLLDLTATLAEVSRIFWQVNNWIIFMTLYITCFVWMLLSVSLTILWHLRKKEQNILILLWASQRFWRNNLSFEYFLLLSFASLWVMFIGTIVSVYFFYNLSFLDLELNTLFTASVIIVFWISFLFLTLIFPNIIKNNKKIWQDIK